MVTKSKLKMALQVEKGVDHHKLKMKKKEKLARKKKSSTKKDNTPSDQQKQLENNIKTEKKFEKDEGEGQFESESEEDDGHEESDSIQAKIANIDESDSDSVIDEDEDNAEEDEEDSDIPVSDLGDLSEEEREDLIPHQRLTINNTLALNTVLKRISLPISEIPFSEHQSITTSAPVEVADISDDLNRELSFYAQCLSAAQEGRKILKSEGTPFTRPTDYFAEMVKADEHMAKIKAKLIDEAASKKASAEARKLRDLKKFGKQVQVAKIQERDRERKQTLEKIKVLKRKRQGGDTANENEADLFDVAIDAEIGSTKPSNNKRDGNNRRHKKDEKFGFGGKKKFKKSGDAFSSGDLRGFSSKKMKGGSKPRPGKTRRASKR